MNKIISFGIYANQTDKRWNTLIEEIEQLEKELNVKRDKLKEYDTYNAN